MELTSWYQQIEDSYTRIRPHVRKTPLQFSFELSELGKASVYLKLGKSSYYLSRQCEMLCFGDLAVSGGGPVDARVPIHAHP